VLLLTALQQLVQVRRKKNGGRCLFDFFSQAGGSTNTGREVQADVIYFGLGALLQHMNEQLLDYPKLQARQSVWGWETPFLKLILL